MKKEDPKAARPSRSPHSKPRRGAGVERPPPRRRRWHPRWSARAKRFTWIALAALVGLGVLAAAVLYLGFGKRPRHLAGASVELDLPPGLQARELAERLEEAGVVDSAVTMRLFLEASGGVAQVSPGPHVFFDGQSPWDLRRSLERWPGAPRIKVTIPEGMNRFDLASRLEKLRVAGRKGFLSASSDPLLLEELAIEAAGKVGAESAEGYLFPATYEFGPDSDPRQIVRRLVQESNTRWESLANEYAGALVSLQTSLGWSRREILTLASVIEEEAAVDEERPLIASVFLNRLLDPTFRPRRLQSDPTAMYGCVAAPEEAPSCANYAGRASHAINADTKNRYSTYTHNGLPPGPISNPGLASVRAVLAPAATRYFYFVAAGRGRHTFNETFEAHHGAVQLRAAGASASEGLGPTSTSVSSP